MANGIVRSVSALVAACNKKVARISKKLRGEEGESSDGEGTVTCRSKTEEEEKRWSGEACLSPYFPWSSSPRKREEERRWNAEACLSPYLAWGDGGRRKKEQGRWNGSPEKKVKRRPCDGGGGADGLWRRTILLGEKCRPLDFEGVIHYDGEGRLLAVPPRSPLRSPLPSFVLRAAVSSGDGGKY